MKSELETPLILESETLPISYDTANEPYCPPAVGLPNVSDFMNFLNG